MKQFIQTLNRFESFAESAEAMFVSDPLVEIAGGRRVLIENHQGVCEYACTRIRINTKSGGICVCGSDLELAHISKERVVITGIIDSVSILRGRE